MNQKIDRKILSLSQRILCEWGIKISIWFVVPSTRVYIVKEINRKVFKTKADSIKMYTGLHSFKEKNEINKMDKSLTQVLSIRLGGPLYCNPFDRIWCLRCIKWHISEVTVQ